MITRDRPLMPQYGVPESTDGLLEWNFVNQKIKEAKNYWISTIDAHLQPHSTPVWGVWIKDRFFFSCDSKSIKSKNLTQLNKICVSLENADHPVIIEGLSEKVLVKEEFQTILEVYTQKYPMAFPDDSDLWKVVPLKVLAWEKFPSTCTRFANFLKNDAM